MRTSPIARIFPLVAQPWDAAPRGRGDDGRMPFAASLLV
jgi:hypothetical protein